MQKFLRVYIKRRKSRHKPTEWPKEREKERVFLFRETLVKPKEKE